MDTQHAGHKLNLKREAIFQFLIHTNDIIVTEVRLTTCLIEQSDLLNVFSVFAKMSMQGYCQRDITFSDSLLK